MRISNVVPTKTVRDGVKRNLKTSKTWLSISLAAEDEGEKKAEDDSQGFLLNVMNR